MNVEAHYQSLTKELEALRDRVRNFIHSAHWLTDGEWKESVIRSMLAMRLPETVKIGRGFVLTNDGPTTQCDILLYRSSAPILFREADLVFLTPDAVLGIIEVKSSASATVLSSALDKFAQIGPQLCAHRDHCFFGLFSYQCSIRQDAVILDILREKCNQESKIVDLLSLGCNKFVKWWRNHPQRPVELYRRWHSYQLPNMAAGYFMSNVIDSVSPLGSNSWLWFPEEGKESKKTDDRAFSPAVAEQAVVV